MMIELYQGDCLEVLKRLPDNSVDAVITDPPYGWAFMSKKWDYDVPKVEIWQEVLRVLKHGGHALVACGTRTQHRMAVNVEDAGFEIRDIVSWIYGSGFPKSLNIGKAIDKLQGNEREIVGHYQYEGRRPSGVGGKNNGDICYGDYKAQPEMLITKGNSQWEGWGTALKPACELFTLVRKPLSEKTVAENVLKWGTGGINIDACRIGTSEKPFFKSGNIPSDSGMWKSKKRIDQKGHSQGRFPANIIHDGSEEVLAVFPETKSGSIMPHHITKESENNCMSGKNYLRTGLFSPASQGSASRFFYCAKASKSERNAGLDDVSEPTCRPSGIAYNEYSGVHTEKRKGNHHPTVKPIKLMEYLIKLITPENGIVLDCFMGSGTTGIAAKRLNRNFIGIELNQEYFEIAKARIENETSIFNQIEGVAA